MGVMGGHMTRLRGTICLALLAAVTLGAGCGCQCQPTFGLVGDGRFWTTDVARAQEEIPFTIVLPDVADNFYLIEGDL